MKPLYQTKPSHTCHLMATASQTQHEKCEMHVELVTNQIRHMIPEHPGRRLGFCVYFVTEPLFISVFNLFFDLAEL